MYAQSAPSGQPTFTYDVTVTRQGVPIDILRISGVTCALDACRRAEAQLQTKPHTLQLNTRTGPVSVTWTGLECQARRVA